MTYMSTADKTSQDWQKNLDQSVVIAIKEKQPRIMKLLVDSGANLDQLNEEKPLLVNVFESADSDILYTFLEGCKGFIASQLQSITKACRWKNVLQLVIKPQRLDLVKRVFTLLQENNISLDKWAVGSALLCATGLAPHKKYSANTDNRDQNTDMTGSGCEILEYLLEQGLDVNNFAITPLHAAVMAGNIEAVECLIKHGADVTARGDMCETPLHYAAQYRNKETVQCLIKHGADVMARDTLDMTPFHSAVYNENKEVVPCLIMHGAEVMARDGRGWTPLHEAALAGSIEAVQCLTKHGADVMARDQIDKTPLHEAAVNGNQEVVQCLLENGADVMARSDGIKATNRNMEAFQRLIMHGAELQDWNHVGCTPLHCAVQYRRKEAVQCLIKYGADAMVMDENSSSPWMIACQRKELDIMTELSKGVDLKRKLANGRSFLHLSCLHGWTDGTKYLLENGADVNCIDDSNVTALFVVMFLDQYRHELSTSTTFLQLKHYFLNRDREKDVDRQLMQILGDFGADVNHRDKTGHTLLMKREIYRQKHKREFLIKHGADLNAVGHDGLTVLWTAIEYDCEAEFYLIDDLLARNIDIGLSQYKYEGMTPLQLAYSKGNYELCDTLLDAGCSFHSMLEILAASINPESDESMQQIRSRILELSAQPYSLQELSRQAVLKGMCSGNLVEKVHCMKEDEMLPVNMLNFLIRNLGFEIEVALLPLDKQNCEVVP